MQITSRDSLKLGGFAGLTEHQLVMDPRAFGPHASPGSQPGLGHFIYLADARFNPHGETRMHGHREVDVISVMVEGRIAHEGSLEHGQELQTDMVQVQRAGGEGFSHNEINPDDHRNRMLQLWVAPETAGEPASYQIYHPAAGKITRIYGGSGDKDQQPVPLAAHTCLDIAHLEQDQKISAVGPALFYMITGSGLCGDQEVFEGDLIRGEDLTVQISSSAQVLRVSLEN